VITLRALEILVVASLIILAVVAMVFFIRDLISLKPASSISELQLLFTSLFVVIVLIELLRTFVAHRDEERYLEGFLEAGIVILLREVALGALSGNVMNALIASGGALLLILGLMVLRRFMERERGEEGRDLSRSVSSHDQTRSSRSSPS
jgi:uncharacterized membrane protein (DUF373 family)